MDDNDINLFINIWVIMNKDMKSLELEVNLLHERICSALSDTKRIMILYLLAKKDMFVNEISEALSTPQSTISRHLRVLRERSLVSTERRGTKFFAHCLIDASSKFSI